LNNNAQDVDTETAMSHTVGFEGRMVGSIDLMEDGTRSSVTTNADLNDR